MWDVYARWNEAVADAVFPELPGAAPVYLDLEDDTLAEVARLARYEGEPREGLRQAVGGMIVVNGNFSLSALEQHQFAWRRRRDRASPPPCLAFLALCVLAAEDMGRDESGLDANDYYSRLCLLLGLPRDHAGVRSNYMRRAEDYWGALNLWLEHEEGLRGTPTAYALSYRYIGLPMSQALVRETDRRKFPGFFAQYGLAAGMDLAPEVLERYLDAWFASETCTASAPLKRLWARALARERIATVAAVELASWDGVVESGHVQATLAQQRVGLVAQLRRGFRGSSLDLALTFRTPAGEADFGGLMEVESAEGKWLPLTFTPSVANLWRTGMVNGGLDFASALDGVIKLRLAANAEHVYRRPPRHIIPLVFDELQAAFVEQERLQLNVDCMLLVRTSGGGRGLSKVRQALDTCARPGFEVQDHLTGLPPGWALISGVQLFGTPPAAAGLNELVPLARDQLTVAGGLRIPSRVRKWSSTAPPELRVSVASATALRLELRGLDDEALIKDWSTDAGAMVAPLADLALPPGDYRASLFAGSARAAVQQVTLRLRSADWPDAGWALAPRLLYQLGGDRGPLGAFSASEVEDQHPLEPFIDGALAAGSDLGVLASPAPTKPVWNSPRPHQIPQAALRIGTPSADSCVVTGAHFLEYPTWYGGRAAKFIDGVCKYCGLVKRTPGWVSARRFEPDRRQAYQPAVDVAALAPVTNGVGLWEAAMDALMHLGGGDASRLLGVAAQLDGTSMFAADFPRALEALGHIAVERAANGLPTRWEVSPTCLAEVPDGLMLVGFWPDRLVEQVLNKLQPLGGRLRRVPNPGGPVQRLFVGVAVASAVDVLNDLGVTIAPDAGTAIAHALPTLSEVGRALQREPMPGFSEAERYDVTSSTWVRTNDVSTPGAYRLVRGFERAYMFRDQADVINGVAARSSVYLAKHLAANLIGTTLAFYLSKKSCIVVPRGCQFPGVYERSLSLASGTLPREGDMTMSNTKRACLIYPEVTQQQADLVCSLMSN